MTDAAQVADVVAKLSEAQKRAVLAAPFNSKGIYVRLNVGPGDLGAINANRCHLGAGPLLVRKRGPGYTGNYSLTPLGLAVRDALRGGR